MPGGAPPPLQFAPLQYAKADPSQSLGSQMQGLGKSLKSSGLSNYLNPTQPAMPAVAPGTAVPGTGAQPIMAGGPQGPVPFTTPPPGTPYSPASGPVAPPPPQQSVLNPQQAALQQPQPPLPTPAMPYPPPPQGPQLSPLSVLNVLRSWGTGIPPQAPQGQPGTALLNNPGTGVLPGSPGFGG